MTQNIDTTKQKLHLLASVCATLVHEPTFYSTVDVVRNQIEAACEALVSHDPEFILKTAYYVRDELNIRSTANFLLAWASTHNACRPFLKKYFSATVRLPSDLLDVMTMVTVQTGVSKESFPTMLRKVAAAKFAEFDVYSLAKYNKEKSQKQKKRKQKKADTEGSSTKKPKLEKEEDEIEEIEEDEIVETKEKCNITDKNKMTLKQLIRRLHIAEPVEVVMGILGAKYPADAEAFQKSKLSGVFEPERANKRMRLPVPETWETQLSAKGNKHETWEELMDHNKLPFMAMLRNLRNFIITGISPAHHEKIIGRLTDEKSVTSSRQLPWRFLSAYDAIKVDLETMMNDILDHDGSEFKIISVKVKGRKGKQMGATRQIKKRVVIPFHMPDLPLIDRYRGAVDTAIRISSAHNLPPVEGNTVIFVDVSGSMDTPAGGNARIPSLQSCKDVAILLGLMLQNACDECNLRIFSSPKSHGDRPDLPVENLREGSILENVSTVRKEAEKLGGGTDFPYDFVKDLTHNKQRVDTMVILSDMMIAPGKGGAITIDQVLADYRAKVNPEMLFITVNLKGESNATAVDASNDKNVLITGFSDNILRLVAERGSTKQLERVERMDVVLAEKSKPKVKKEKKGKETETAVTEQSEQMVVV